MSAIPAAHSAVIFAEALAYQSSNDAHHWWSRNKVG